MRAPSGACATPSSLCERGKRQHEQMDELLARSGTPMGEHGILTASNNQLTTESPWTHTHRTTPTTDTVSGLNPGVHLQSSLFTINLLYILCFFGWSKVYLITVTSWWPWWSRRCDHQTHSNSFSIDKGWRMILAKYELNYLHVSWRRKGIA